MTGNTLYSFSPSINNSALVITSNGSSDIALVPITGLSGSSFISKIGVKLIGIEANEKCLPMIFP